MTQYSIPLITSVILFTMGTIGVMSRKDLLRLFLCVSIMLASITLLIVTLAQGVIVQQVAQQQTLVLFVWAVEIAEIIIAVTMFVRLGRNNASHINDLRNFRW